jgi:hypothetical protein
MQKSYLDYFLVKNEENCLLDYFNPIGRSEVRLFWPFSKILRVSETIGKQMAIALNSPFPVKDMLILVNSLRIEHKPVIRKSRSHFKLIKGWQKKAIGK